MTEGSPKDVGKMRIIIDDGKRPHVGVVPGSGGVDGERFIRQMNAIEDRYLGYDALPTKREIFPSGKRITPQE